MSNNVTKELKRSKYTMILFFIFLGLFIIGWIVYGIVMPSGDENQKYGNRLEDIEKANAVITKNDTAKIVVAVEKKDFVKEASTSVEGRIVNVIVAVKSGTSVKDAKTLGDTILDSMSDKHKKYYDVQLFVKNEDSSSKGFPFIGYKNSSDKGFVF